MDAKEVRMRCIEAVSSMGVREPSRMVKDAKELEAWVSEAEDKAEAPKRGRPAKNADNG
jgi:predicted transcriptional regulator